MATRDRNLRVRMNDEDLRMLSAIAERERTTASAWLRKKIFETYRRLFGNVPPPPAKP
jgi:Leu/Phe-tRNA-protein transferase